MSGAGRPSKPTHLKVLTGTLRPSRINGDEPQPALGAKPPSWLGPIALEEWSRLAPGLEADGLLTERDQTEFALMCDAVEKIAGLNAIMKTSDIQIAASGQNYPQGLAMLKHYKDTHHRASQRFGLSPSDRPGLSVTKKPKTESKWATLSKK